ncbi:MAG: PDZ domain-containing protein [Desulfovibrio sp.]|nr:PDZ domain-containing protein [Desulfovibrio sp.]
MRIFSVVVVLLTLVGCVNPYKQYYSLPPGIDSNRIAMFSDKCDSVQIYSDAQEGDTILKMYKNGYAFIGSSSFNASNASKSDLENFSKEIKACLVLVKSKYTHTEQGVYSFPQYVPGQSVTVNTYGTAYSGNRSVTYQGTATGTTSGYFTSQSIPYSVARSDYLATYWVKLKPPVFGAFGEKIPDDIRKKLNLDKGVLVTAVMNNSPADVGGLMDGDIVIKLDTVEMSMQNWRSTWEGLAGKEVDVEILRDGKSMIKKVSFGTKQ